MTIPNYSMTTKNTILKKHGSYDYDFFNPKTGNKQSWKTKGCRVFVYFSNQTGSYKIHSCKTVSEAKKIIPQHYAWVKAEIKAGRVPCSNGFSGPDDDYKL